MRKVLSRWIQRIRDTRNQGNLENSTQHTRSSSGGSGQQCWYCTKIGHVKKDCRLRQAAHRLRLDSSRSLTTTTSKQEPGTVNFAVHDELSQQNIRQALMVFSSSSISHDLWIVDSGASDHYCCYLPMFSVYETLPTPKSILLGDNHTIVATAIGSVRIGSLITLNNVFYVPDLRCNLLSVSKVVHLGLTVQFSKEEARNGSLEGSEHTVWPI